MTFVVRMVVRELRASWRRLLFFFVCVAIGVGAIVALRSVIQSVRTGLMREARAIVSADVLVSTNRPWTPQVRERLDQRLASAPILQRLESIETATMVRGEQGAAAKMVELKGVQNGFPLYGQLVLADGVTFSHDLLENRGALVRPDLLVHLGIRTGDRIVIGGHPFTIRGVIEQEPGRRVGAFSFGSRVIVDYADLRATGLLTFGSRASYQLQLRVEDEAVRSLVRDLRRDFRNDFINTRSYQSTEDDIGEDLQRAENYLSLVGFIMVILGGIGVWSVTRVFVRQKIRSVAILKCLGATTAQILSTYVVQVILLGLTGSLLGVVIAWIAIASIPPSLAASFGGVSYGLTISAVLQGLFVGLIVSVLFSLAPLLEVRRVKPLLLLRGLDAQIARARVDWIQVGVMAIVSAALVSIAAWQAASWQVGLIVTGGFAVVTLLLHGAGILLVRAVRPLAAAPWFPLRHAVGSLRRPGNQTRVILLAVGLGSFFVIGVRALQSNLIEEFTITLDQAGADMFLIDIQQDQLEGIRQLVKARAGVEPRLIPVLRARVTGVSGKENNLDTVSDVRGRGGLSREFVITYRNHLEPNEKLVEGTFWSGQPPLPDDAAELQVTVEKGIHERSRVAVGDLMRFDILGRIVNARVVGIREVEWGDARNGGFMFVFRPGPLARAPHSYIATLRAPDAVAERATFQRDLVAAYPNVSAIDVREVLATIQGIVDNVTLAISIVGGVAVASGVLILIGAVAMTKFQRVYEAAILRTLGASTRLLTTMLALEYSALGLLAGCIGAAGALALTWGISRYVFDIPWHPAPGVLAAGAFITTALVGIIGVVASFDVLRKKPLATLRAE
ncbi:MAG: FtsX-like permease family protein [Vicinamibacterales bacterium]